MNVKGELRRILSWMRGVTVLGWIIVVSLVSFVVLLKVGSMASAIEHVGDVYVIAVFVFLTGFCAYMGYRMFRDKLFRISAFVGLIAIIVFGHGVKYTLTVSKHKWNEVVSLTAKDGTVEYVGRKGAVNWQFKTVKRFDFRSYGGRNYQRRLSPRSRHPRDYRRGH